MYGHEVLMSLQTQANFLAIQSTKSVTVSVIFQRDLISCGQRLSF
jgi:hypothetical protein